MPALLQIPRRRTAGRILREFDQDVSRARAPLASLLGSALLLPTPAVGIYKYPAGCDFRSVHLDSVLETNSLSRSPYVVTSFPE